MKADSDVYTWGCGSAGVLGHNDEDDKLVLTKLNRSLFQRSKVVAAAGALNSKAVITEGTLFV